LYVALRHRPKEELQDVSTARKLIVEEVALLRRARQQGVVGQSTFESTQRVLLTALARLMARQGSRSQGAP